MRRLGKILPVVALGVLRIAAPTMAHGQDLPATSLRKTTTTVELGSMRVCLRLEDEKPLPGPAYVEVRPEGGYELLGTPGNTQGEYVFFAVAEGRYRVDAYAKGYTSVRVIAEMDAGSGEKEVVVVMKPGGGTREEVSQARSPEPLRETIAELEPARESSAAAGPELEEGHWRAHELEEALPDVDSAVACPMDKLLEGAGERMREFVDTLEKFTATEYVEHYPIDRTGARRDPEKRNFAYVVTVSQNALGTFLLSEYRNGTTDPGIFPGQVASYGLPAIALIFHPVLASDFEFRCEGMANLGGRNAWLVHFAQRADRRVRIRSYVVNTAAYPAYLEGRVWIEPNTNQVLRLESELAKPIPQIGLTREHLSVAYAAVQFASTGEEIWLPQQGELYVERRGKRFYRRHSFSDFKLFNVDTAQNLYAPKGSYSITNLTDRDVTGELTITPVETVKREPIMLRFTVPAHGHVIKVVGPGKDVNLAAGAVASARFVHNGDAGSVKVDADLVKETTIDVMPESAVMTKP
jgi:hypothetical protein